MLRPWCWCRPAREITAASLIDATGAAKLAHMTAQVISTNIAHPQPDPGGQDRVSGIDKRPTDHIQVFTPGPNYGDGSGVTGDVVGDSLHHGGAQKAVYAFAREELDYWQGELGRGLSNGSFGENLTTSGIDLATVLINQQVRIGTALLEVSVPRRPCRTFGAWLEQRGWMKTFTQRYQCGTYFRVIEAGEIRPGDQLEFLAAPEHGIDMGTTFRAKMGDKDAARRVVAAQCLPERYHEEMVRILG